MENNFFEDEAVQIIRTPIHGNNTPMRDFIRTGINLLFVDLTPENEDALYNIAHRFDNAALNGDRNEINNSVNDLFELCRADRNVHDLIYEIIDKNVIYIVDNSSITEILNNNGFDTRLFKTNMHINSLFRLLGMDNNDNVMMDNGDRESAINKCFRFGHMITFEDNLLNLSDNLDINEVCLTYQQNPTELNKQNLINVIMDNTTIEDKLSLAHFRIDKDITFETLINYTTNSDLGTCLKNKLQVEIALNNLMEANNALINNQQDRML